jgi:hypothetical protein
LIQVILGLIRSKWTRCGNTAFYSKFLICIVIVRNCPILRGKYGNCIFSYLFRSVRCTGPDNRAGCLRNAFSPSRIPCVWLQDLWPAHIHPAQYGKNFHSTVTVIVFCSGGFLPSLNQSFFLLREVHT